MHCVCFFFLLSFHALAHSHILFLFHALCVILFSFVTSRYGTFPRPFTLLMRCACLLLFLLLPCLGRIPLFVFVVTSLCMLPISLFTFLCPLSRFVCSQSHSQLTHFSAPFTTCTSPSTFPCPFLVHTLYMLSFLFRYPHFEGKGWTAERMTKERGVVCTRAWAASS